jgi:dsDNA-specific endonuclease/ATPase MutS2
MCKLQQLLDEKWPMSDVHSNTDKGTYEMFRQIFTEGYNAAKEEAKAAQVSDVAIFRMKPKRSEKAKAQLIAAWDDLKKKRSESAPENLYPIFAKMDRIRAILYLRYNFVASY